MQAAALLSFCFAGLIVLISGPVAVNSQSPIAPKSPANLPIVSLAKIDAPKSTPALIDMVLASAKESDCKAVYNESLVAALLSRFPQFRSRLKGLSKEQQYRACVARFRANKGAPLQLTYKSS